MKRTIDGIDGLQGLGTIKSTLNVEKCMFLSRYLLLVSKLEICIYFKGFDNLVNKETNTTQTI